MKGFTVKVRPVQIDLVFQGQRLRVKGYWGFFCGLIKVTFIFMIMIATVFCSCSCRHNRTVIILLVSWYDTNVVFLVLQHPGILNTHPVLPELLWPRTVH